MKTEKKLGYPEVLRESLELQEKICKEVFGSDYKVSHRIADVVGYLEDAGKMANLTNNAEYYLAIKTLKKFTSYVGGLITGQSGERRTYDLVRFLDLSWTQFAGVNLSYGSDFAEYDQILVSDKGIFILEVKNYNHQAYIDEDGVIRSTQYEDFEYRLLERTEAKGAILRSLLSEKLETRVTNNNIHYLLVNANNSIRIDDNFRKIPICNLVELKDELFQLAKSTPCFTDKDVEEIRDVISESHINELKINSNKLKSFECAFKTAVDLISTHELTDEHIDVCLGEDYRTEEVSGKTKYCVKGIPIFDLGLRAATLAAGMVGAYLIAKGGRYY